MELPKFEKSKLFSDKWYVFDLEIFSNLWTLIAYSFGTNTCETFKIYLDDPKDVQESELNRQKEFFEYIIENDCVMVGYNSIGYDYVLLHHLLKKNPQTPKEWVDLAKQRSDKIINTPYEKRFSNMIWESDRLFRNVDLMKIHYLDSIVRATSLKALEAEMRMESIEETPVDFNLPCPADKVDDVLKYNRHDVYATTQFMLLSYEEIKFRQELKSEYPKYDFLNMGDSKIGATLMKLEYQNQCGWQSIYEIGKDGKIVTEDGRKVIKQSPVDKIVFDDLIFDYIEFERPEFNAVLDWFRATTVTETKGALTQLKPKDLSDDIKQYMEHDEDGNIVQKTADGKKGVPNLHVIIDDVKFVFGTGGLHASVEDEKFEATDELMIVDLDVKSYYANLCIGARIYPEHLGEDFCDIYEDMYEQRKKHKKGSMENLSRKLGLNAVFGESNSPYSIFFSPNLCVRITVNGQLLLCSLIEKMMHVDGYRLAQANTDGVTFLAKRSAKRQINDVCREWMKLTNLELEGAKYSKLFMKNVNNYLGVDEDDGSIKRKGMLYCRIRRDTDTEKKDLQFHQNQSNLASKLAAEKYMLEGIPITQTLENHDDLLDFTLRAKVDRSSKLILGSEDYDVTWNFEKGCLVFDGNAKEQQRLSRYYVSKTGETLTKWMAPTRKKLSLDNKKRLMKIAEPDFTLKKCMEIARDETLWSPEFKQLCDYLHDNLQKKTFPDLDLIDEKYHDIINEKICSKPRATIIERGSGKEPWKIKIINHTTHIDKNDIDMDYYIEQSKKTIIE